MSSLRSLLTVAFAGVLAGACAARQAPGEGAHQAVRVGLVLPFSGEYRHFGEDIERGVRLALADRDGAGAQARRTITLVARDSYGSREWAADAVDPLVDDEGVVAILGEALIRQSLAMAPHADARRVPLVSPLATNPRVTRDGVIVRPYVFATCAANPRHGTAMARFARERLGLWRVAVLADPGSEYSTLMAEAFKAEWKRLGGTVTLEQRYRGGGEDFRPALAPFKGPAAEAIYVPGYHHDVGRIARQARDLGLTQVLLGADGWDSPRVFDTGGDALDGAYYTNHAAADDPDPRTQAVVRRYRAAHGEAPGVPAMLAYDAASLLFDAIDRAERPTGPDIREALERTRAFPGVSGAIAFDAWHTGEKPLVVLRIEGRTPRFEARVPAGAAAPVELPWPGD